MKRDSWKKRKRLLIYYRKYDIWWKAILIGYPPAILNYPKMESIPSTVAATMMMAMEEEAIIVLNNDDVDIDDDDDEQEAIIVRNEDNDDDADADDSLSMSSSRSENLSLNLNLHLLLLLLLLLLLNLNLSLKILMTIILAPSGILLGENGVAAVVKNLKQFDIVSSGSLQGLPLTIRNGP